MARNTAHAALLQRSLDRHTQRLAHDPDLQQNAPLPEAVARLAAEGRSSIASIALACSLYADRPALAERAYQRTAEGALRWLSSYTAIRYSDLWERVSALASGLGRTGMLAAGERAVISGPTGVDWVIAEYACLYLAAVSVPLQAGVAPADVQQILEETAPAVVVCSAGQLDALAPVIIRCPSVRAVVLMGRGGDRGEGARAVRDAGRAVTNVADVERSGREQGILPAVDPAEARGEADPLMSILYTSGSTGTPKGAMFPESILREQWRAPVMERLPLIAHLSLCYMPLSHAAGRFEVMAGVLRGGLTSFVAAGDMSTLFEDLRLVRPTRLMLVPRISSLIHQQFQAEVVRRAGSGPTAPVEGEVMAEMRHGPLGDRLVYALAGTAPTAPEIIDFLELCFDVPVLDGYGSTEAGMISFDGRIVAEEVVAYKIVDVPELGYRRSDKPSPRGELCVQTRRMVPGYYRNEAATKELYDGEGWLHTGDIVALRGDGEIAWLDRKKNVLKLAQGEFVSTARLEGLYAARSPFIAQIYVHGSSHYAYLLSVVVPDARAVAARLGEGAPEAAVKRLLRDEIDRVARAEGLPSWEVPREILIEPHPFTRDDGLLTESNKPSRPGLAARYGERLAAAYAAIERAQVDRLRALEEQEGDAGVVEQAVLAAEIALGVGDVDPMRSFSALGGDSIAAVRLSSLLTSRFDVEVPVGLILDPTSSLAGIARYIEDHLAGDGRGVSFADVHGEEATKVRASDLRLDRVIPSALGRRAPGPPPASFDVRVAFLTGASGFLGRFLLLDLLDRLPRGGKVVCVVRAASNEEAHGRLASVFRSDPALAQRFSDLAAGRLTALAGDLMKARFGLPDAVFERLAGEVDAVIHAGALVNHALPYRALFEPNVLGTAEAIRLCARGRPKALTYVSTVGVAGGIDRQDPVREDEEADALSPARAVNGGYAAGYATSKWAGEILVREAASRFDLPVAVCRCSMIMPHRCYTGQVNAGDFLTRLFAGLIATGVAPRSFYASPEGHHFDGLPVDFVAGAIASIAANPEAGFSLYHVVNPHAGDGVSLDTFTTWLETAGYALDRVDDHARWIATFAERLAALPAEERQRSPLSILSQWERPLQDDLRFDASHLKQRIGGEIPLVTERYLHKYLRDMAAIHLVPPPARERDTAA